MSEIRRAIAAGLEGTRLLAPPDRVSASFSFGEDFPGFQGHFPSQPILPAIVQIQLVIYAAEAFAKADLALSAVETAKFKRPLTPGVTVDVDCSCWTDSDLVVVDATLSVKSVAASSMSISCTRSAPEVL